MNDAVALCVTDVGFVRRPVPAAQHLQRHRRAVGARENSPSASACHASGTAKRQPP
jgi:hypothetical protein